jgi:hypothetical protein
MSPEAKLLLKRSIPTGRWTHQEQGDYDLERFGEKFRETLYSPQGLEVLRARRQKLLETQEPTTDETR